MEFNNSYDSKLRVVSDYSQFYEVVLVCIFSWSSWSSVQLGVVQWRHIISGGGRAGAARRGRRRSSTRAVPGRGLRSPTGCASFTLIREKNKRWPHARTKANKREAAHRPPCFMVDCCGTGAAGRADSHFNCPLPYLYSPKTTMYVDFLPPSDSS